ncbi:MAG TPA: excinuclease ABC subunit UvrA [Verrucomicrobiales bacterium]|nr:excinuclease ABC subunit UvrA [Verrucomicrobiales bacterium]
MVRRRRLPEGIRIRGARQNNLANLSLDVPLNQLTVVTGPSGSGKSSLAFQTLYAEGQRRYVETFSPYTRQFFDRMDKPQVDAIEGTPPAIAIEQSNQVRTSRSTVGTITEINDYLKLFFPAAAEGFCPRCGGPARPDSPASILRAAAEQFGDGALLVTFPVPVPPGMGAEEFFGYLRQQGYLRLLREGKVVRIDEDAAEGSSLPPEVEVIQDRVTAGGKTQARMHEAIERALHLGRGRLALAGAETGQRQAYSRGWHCASCDLQLQPPTPALFSFNHPLGACPVCRGFGRTIGIDLDRAIPDRSLSLAGGAVKAFHGERNQECQDDLERQARARGLDLRRPFHELSEEDQNWVWYGDGGRDSDPEEAWKNGRWYGVQGFFDWMERRAYRMHVRVFLSRFRSYTVCRACKGGRLQPGALAYRFRGKTLPELWDMPVDVLLEWMREYRPPDGDSALKLLHGQIASRLGYLERIGLGYLSLDRPARTLSGGELQRVNLTTCLGAGLVNTLFVLDEPSVGLHARDTSRLIEVLHGLRDQGNTLVVVEHEEAVMRAADHIVDLGPGRGDGGGRLVFAGPLEKLERARSLTGDYLSGRKVIATPAVRRKPRPGACLQIRGATCHNLRELDVDIPLGLFTCVTGVSGSGKSTLVHEVLYRGLCRQRGEATEGGEGRIRSLTGHEGLSESVMVDQSPLARTPRSTPAVFIGAFDLVRRLFAQTDEAKAQGLLPGYFSFNSGQGRCERCAGIGFEKVEMQFLSDIFVRCPECEGRRFQKAALAVRLGGLSVHEVLELTVSAAIPFFQELGGRLAAQTAERLSALEEVGLDYLKLGQPVNTLSGGEAQRLKLVGHLLARGASQGGEGGALLIFDEPTTGLHLDDVALLMSLFQRLADRGHTVLVIEHHLDVIKCADHVIDLGPEAGCGGGRLVASGSPEEVAAAPGSHTGAFLAQRLEGGGASLRAAETAPEWGGRPAAIDTRAIRIRGAREHNLKNIDLEIPRDKIVVVTGLSGSGKSTLAFDILFAEGQRRFLDSMSTYARQFTQQMERPEVDVITGLPPTVAIEQRISRGGGRSTVATVTEIYHFLRLLYAKLGAQHCPACGIAVRRQTAAAIAEEVGKALGKGRVRLLAPLIKARKGLHTEVAAWAAKQGYRELLVDGVYLPSEDFSGLERYREHSIDAVTADWNRRTRPGEAALRAAVEEALRVGRGTAKTAVGAGPPKILSTEMSCSGCGRAFEELDPRLFSYNSPHGWCPSCRGFGSILAGARGFGPDGGQSWLEAELQEERRFEGAEAGAATPCRDCGGARLNEVARAVLLQGVSIADFARRAVKDVARQLKRWRFRQNEAVIARDIVTEMTRRLRFLEETGLGYLGLDRSAGTLSGGEAQRIRLAAQLGSNLRGVLYVLDEPTIGLHPRDNAKLLDTLELLRSKGNSLVVVEHDEETMRRADRIIDLGPGAGRYGGEVVAEGSVAAICRARGSLTGLHLRRQRTRMRGERRPIPPDTASGAWLRVFGASANNLQGIDVALPLGRLVGIAGVSGSGKSSLVRGVILPAVQAAIGRRAGSAVPGEGRVWKRLSGAGGIAAVYEVDQSPLGKTSRSTPATYIKVFDEIRRLFAGLPEARLRGFTAGRFSFNTEGGRCETCRGNGRVRLEMSFLPASWVRCEDCRGQRYNAATLEATYRGKNIGEVMEMTVAEACQFFEAHPRIRIPLELLRDTGTGYLQLGQPSPTLSGGEAQRVKLVHQLARGSLREAAARRRGAGSIGRGNLYLIEEPSIGLHPADVDRLVAVLHGLVDEGHCVVVIEHNADILAEADFLIELGPEAGSAGGRVVAKGTPEAVCRVRGSRTAPYLKRALGLEGAQDL